MNIKVDAYKKSDLRTLASRIEIKASHFNLSHEKKEAELISRLYREINSGNCGSLLYYLQQVQDNEKEVRFVKKSKIKRGNESDGRKKR